MTMQPYFNAFHRAILLEDNQHYSIVRAVREEVISKFYGNGSVPREWTFETYNWGSYAMGTGIRPLRGLEYDMDLGLVFNASPREVDSQLLKRSIYNKLINAGYHPEWKRPCLSLAFDGFHIDMSVCSREGGRLFLAEGKQHDGNARWRPDGMEWFVQMISSHPNPTDSQQFRRVVRYLKRWKDVHFGSDGMKGPVGLALTVMAYHWFPTNCDDLGALRTIVRNAITYFSSGNLALKFPYEPSDDLLRKMSRDQVLQMLGRFRMLSTWLDDAATYQRTDCLVRAFGSDFPAY